MDVQILNKHKYKDSASSQSGYGQDFKIYNNNNNICSPGRKLHLIARHWTEDRKLLQGDAMHWPRAVFCLFFFFLMRINQDRATLVSKSTSLNWKSDHRHELVRSLGGTFWSWASHIELVTNFVGSLTLRLAYSVPVNFLWMQASSCELGWLCCSAGGETRFKFAN